MQPLLVLVLSGVAGFRIGYVAFPSWQVAVQTAQVVAGIVHYPHDNPLYTYHTKLWTLLHQLIAPLLVAGISERQVSLVLSGVLGMLALQALAMVTFALSRNLLLAIGVAFLVFFTRAAEHGVTYPVLLMGTQHTYGSFGLSLAVLIIGLLGSGCWRLGALLLGIMPSIHPSIGLWLWLTTGLAAATIVRRGRGEFWLALPYLAAGTAITFASLAFQLLFIYDVPKVDPAITRPYLDAFTLFWDGHRQPVSPWHPGVIMNALSLLVAVVSLRALTDRLSTAMSLLLRIVAASACVGLGCVLLSHVPPDRMPVALLTLMPARFLNVDVMLFVALLVGLLGLLRRESAARLMLALTIALVFSQLSMVWDTLDGVAWWPWTRPDPVLVLEIAAVTLVVWIVVVRRRDAAPSANGLTVGASTFTYAAVAVMAYTAVQSWSLRSHAVLQDWTNDPLYAVASQEPNGLMAAGGAFDMTQLQTRRPHVLNPGAIDTLSYAPESAPALDRLLREVYGVDLLHPPADIPRGSGAIPPEFNRRVWEGYSRAQWAAIRRTHNVTQVLTPGNYELDLPVIAQSGAVRLYGIPDQ